MTLDPLKVDPERIKKAGRKMINDFHNIIIKFPVSKQLQQNSREKSNLHQCMLLWKLRITSN